MKSKLFFSLVLVIAVCLSLPSSSNAQVLGGDIGAPNVLNTNKLVYGVTDQPRPMFQAKNVAINLSFINAVLEAGEITTRLERQGKTVVDWSFGTPKLVGLEVFPDGVDPVTGAKKFKYILTYERRVTVWYLDTFDF